MQAKLTLANILIAFVAFILAFVVLTIAAIPYAGLLALVVGILVFLADPYKHSSGPPSRF